MGFTIVLVPTVQSTTCTFCCLGDRKYHHIIGTQTTLRDTFNFYVSQASFSGFKFQCFKIGSIARSAAEVFRWKQRLLLSSRNYGHQCSAWRDILYYTFLSLLQHHYEYKVQRNLYLEVDILNSASWEQNPLGVANPWSWSWLMEPPDDDNGVARGAQKLPVLGRRLEIIGLLVVMTDWLSPLSPGNGAPVFVLSPLDKQLPRNISQPVI